MRIALDYNAALRQPAGIGRYTRDLVRAFLRLQTGDELALFYAARDLPPDHWGMRGLRELQAEFPQVRAAPIPLPERWLTIVWQRARLPIAVERWTGPVDLVHAPDFVLPPIRRAPSLLTVHDLTFRVHPETAFASLRRYLEQAVPRSLQRAGHVLADSESTRRDLQRLMQVPASKITVLYPGVAAHFKRATDPARLQAVQDRYELPERFLFFIGTLEPRKNLEHLIEAYQQVLHATSTAPDALQLALGGKPGWLSDTIVARAEHTPGVRMLGPIDDADLPVLYTLATATVYPSLYEGFGFPVLESLACGTPVLTSDTSSLPEVAGDLGVLVQPASVESIAAGIRRLLDDPALTEAARRRGPDQAARFSWDTAAAQLHAVYRAIAQRQ
ncbi:MAG TPA: glycosyltransferase family 1 protein [Herpetosiphonaceae bacterium]